MIAGRDSEPHLCLAGFTESFLSGEYMKMSSQAGDKSASAPTGACSGDDPLQQFAQLGWGERTAGWPAGGVVAPSAGAITGETACLQGCFSCIPCRHPASHVIAPALGTRLPQAAQEACVLARAKARRR